LEKIFLPFYDLELSQLYSMMMLRQQVFVVEQECAYLDADGLDPECHHLLFYQGDRILAYARIAPPGLQYKEYSSIGRIANHISQRGRGLGRALVSEAIVRTLELWPTHAIKISAQTYLVQFYRTFGFAAVGEEFLEDGIPHIQMVREFK
jgi:ElaA protein